MRRQQFAQKAFIWNGESLFVVRKTSDDPHNPGRWEVPGGRMNFGEDVDQHLCREVSEETGLDVTPGPPFCIWQWTMRDIEPGSDDEIQVIAVARTCTPRTMMLSTANREDTDFLGEMRWVSLDDALGLEIIPSLRPALLEFAAACRSQSNGMTAHERVVPPR